MKPATLDQLKACQFSSWYPNFRRVNKQQQQEAIHNDAAATSKETIGHDPQLRRRHHDEDTTPEEQKRPTPRLRTNVTIRSIIISPLPQEFINYLKSDGIILPKGAEKVSSFLPTDTEEVDQEEEEIDDDEIKVKGDSDGDDENDEFCFSQLNQQIQNALDTLGPCLPKLNWSAPRDVSWMNESTLKCSTVGDVYLLLKSSDFCMFDLEHALDDIDLQQDQEQQQEEEEEDIRSPRHDGKDGPASAEKIIEYELVLRKWSNLHASMEFRCFVAHHTLVGICQRNHAEYYPHLPKECGKIKRLVMEFFKMYIRHYFANGKIGDYVFDVYVDKNDSVWLIDFNLWSTRTDALMFTWEELLDIVTSRGLLGVDPEDDVHDDDDEQEEETEMRVVLNEYDVRFDPLSSYRAPIDTVALATDRKQNKGEEVHSGLQSFEDFMAMCAKPSELVSEEEEEGDDDNDDESI